MIALAGVVATLSLGLSLGAVGGLLGIGGGLIAIPLLAKGYGMDQSMAQGTALVMIVPNVLIGFLRYRQRHDLAWARVAALVLPAVVAAWVSSRFAVALDADHLRLLFAGFLVVIAAVMLLHRPRAQAAAAAPRTPGLARWLLPLVGLASGVMSGLFTVGGGLVVVPLLVLLLDTPQVEAQGLALAAVVPGALVALLSYAQAGRVDWAVGGPLALGGVFTVSLGVAWAHRLSPAVLRGAFTAVLLGTACALSV